MKIKLSEIIPNPYRRLGDYPFDEARLQGLINSINNTGFWDNVLCRNNGDKYELAYGHHRLEALRRIYGDDHFINIPVKEITDADMIRIMADENVTIYEHDPKVITETVRVAKTFLEDNPGEIEKLIVSTSHDVPRRTQRAINDGVGTELIIRFLGGNWSERKVLGALRILRQNNPDIAQSAPTISHAAVVANEELTPHEQKQVVKRIQEGKKDYEGHVRPLTVGETKKEVDAIVNRKLIQRGERPLPLVTSDDIKAIISSCKRFRDAISEDKLKLIKPSYLDRGLIHDLMGELLGIGERIADILGGLRDGEAKQLERSA